MTTLFRCIFFVAAGILPIWSASAEYKVRVEKNVGARMRDGVVLKSDVYRPESDSSFPVLLGRTPYGKQACCPAIAEKLARRGYLVVIQDVRGRGDSDGTFDPFFDDEQDGFDSVEWAAGLPQSNGKVGMTLTSYGGATQIFAALARPPHLVTIFVVEPSIGFGTHQIFFEGGVFRQLWAESWTTLLLQQPFAQAMQRVTTDRELLMSVMRRSPLSNFLEHVSAVPAQLGVGGYFKRWIENEPGSPYWERANLATRVSDINVPGCYIAGWYDVFGPATEALFDAVQRTAGSEIARVRSRLIIGPWNHGMNVRGDGNFGTSAVFDVERYQDQWFDYWLKGVENGVNRQAPVQIFVTGENRWQELSRWRLTSTESHKLFFSRPSANERLLVTARRPSESTLDTLVSDPAQPVPTIGGKLCCHRGYPGGAYSQSALDGREDVLVYNSRPMSSDLTVAGESALLLSVSLDTPDADLMAKLVDVSPTGMGINVADGALRLRYRESLAKPEPARSGQTYTVKVLLGPVAHTFQKGHTLRLYLSGSDFPNYSINFNSGEALSTAAHPRIARMGIHQAFLELPRLERWPQP